MYWYLQKYYVNFSSLNISYQTGARRLLGYQTTVWRKKKRGLKYVYRTLSPDATLAILGTLRSDNAMAVKTSFKSEFTFFQSLARLFLPIYLIKVGPLGVEFLGSLSRFRKTNKILSWELSLFLTITLSIVPINLRTVTTGHLEREQRRLLIATLVIWTFNIFGHLQSKNNKKEEAPHCYRRDAGPYLRSYLIPKVATTLFNKTPFCKNTEVPFERSHFRISLTESKVRTSFNTRQLCTSDTILILIGHRRTAHYQSTLLSLANYLQSIVFIDVEVMLVSDANDVIFASNSIYECKRDVMSW